MPSDADRRLEERASRQRAQFALWQAEEEGVPRSTVYQRASDRRYLERYPLVFAMPGASDSRLAWYQAAVLAVGTASDPAYLSHASAAHLWGFDGCRPDDVIHVISGGHHPRGIAGIRPHRTKTLPDSHVTTRSGIPVTGPDRTLCDLAYRTAFPPLRRAVAGAARHGLITAETLSATAFELGRFRGKRKLLAIVTEMTPMERETANGFESMFLRVMTWAGVRPTAMNHPAVDADGRRRKLDAVWLPGDYPIQQPVWFELDGRLHHSAVLDLNDDRAREDALIRAGWPPPERIGWHDLVQRPDAVVARVHELLDEHRVSGESSQLDCADTR